jgi:hypothetical protein
VNVRDIGRSRRRWRVSHRLGHDPDSNND